MPLDFFIFSDQTGEDGLFSDFISIPFEGDAHKKPLFRVDNITHQNVAILPVDAWTNYRRINQQVSHLMPGLAC